MLIDTHCHIDFSQFDKDRETVIDNARKNGVEYLINVAADLAGSLRCIKLARAYKFIFATAGIHPHYAQQVNNQQIQSVRKLLQAEKVVAVGEVGLDYYSRDNPAHQAEKAFKIRQQEMLLGFIAMAQENKLPIIFHCRDAYEDMAALIRDNLKAGTKAVMHCFSGDKQFLKSCLDLGLNVSFTANITYKSADALREIVAYTPLEHILLETDAPFLAPQAKRGKRNEPAYLKILAEEISQIKNIDFRKVSEVTSGNARDFFNI